MWGETITVSNFLVHRHQPFSNLLTFDGINKLEIGVFENTKGPMLWSWLSSTKSTFSKYGQSEKALSQIFLTLFGTVILFNDVWANEYFPMIFSSDSFEKWTSLRYGQSSKASSSMIWTWSGIKSVSIPVFENEYSQMISNSDPLSNSTVSNCLHWWFNYFVKR